MYTYLIPALSLFLLFSCQREEKREDKSVDQLMEDTDESFPETVKENQQLQQDVRELNSKIKKNSQKRIEGINKELEKEDREKK